MVTQKLRQYGIKENLEKRNYCKEDVNFLGYRIRYNKIQPLISRSQAIIDYTPPKNKKELQRFLGFINYDRKFIRNRTEIIDTLYKLLQNEGRYMWDKTQQAAFEKIKGKWRDELELRIPDLKKTIYTRM